MQFFTNLHELFIFHIQKKPKKDPEPKLKFKFGLFLAFFTKMCLYREFSADYRIVDYRFNHVCIRKTIVEIIFFYVHYNLIIF